MISIKEVTTEAWKHTKDNLLLLIGATVVMFVVQVLLAGASQYVETLSEHVGPILVQAVVYLISGVLSIGMAVISLKVVDGKQPAIADLFIHYRHLWRYVGANILIGVVVFLLALLGITLAYANVPPSIIIGCGIIVGLFAGIFLSFVVYEVVDSEAGPIQALKGSILLAKQAVVPLLGVLIMLILINVLGAMLVFVGLLVTVPFSGVVMAQVYRRLNARVTLEGAVDKIA